MESKYRGINQHDSSHIPQSSSHSYFTEQANRAGYMGPELRWTQHGYIRNDHHHHQPQPQPQPQPHHHSLPYPHYIYEAIRREIEKERIREEIITSEIARRTLLEEEVRRELMMERELALQRGSNGFPIGSSRVMGLSLLGTRAEGWSVEERFGMSLENKERLKGRSESGGFDTLPFQRGTADLRISEVRPASEGSKEKERIILLTKPDENKSGSKRKAVTPPEVDDSADAILKKKSKEEWSCALCQVIATSEKALDEHVRGKKHKSKEAALRAERAGKNYSIGLFPKKATKSIHDVGKFDPGVEEGVTFTAEPLLLKKTGEATSKRDDLPLLQGNPKSNNLKRNQSEVVQKVQKNGDPKKKNYRFWCEMCQVGTISQKVMNAHKKGKKHACRLQKIEQNGGTGPSNQKKIAVLVNRAEEVAEDGKNMTSDNANEVLDEVRSEDHNLMDAVEPEDHQPVGVTEEEDGGDVDIADPEDDLTNDEVKPKDDELIFS